MTGVEYLEKQLTLALGDELKSLRGLFVVAKEMDREHIINAYSEGWQDGQDTIIDNMCLILKGRNEASEKFYEDTFNN